MFKFANCLFTREYLFWWDNPSLSLRFFKMVKTTNQDTVHPHCFHVASADFIHLQTADWTLSPSSFRWPGRPDSSTGTAAARGGDEVITWWLIGFLHVLNILNGHCITGFIVCIYIYIYWLVVWNMSFYNFPHIGNFIIPTDEVIFVGRVGISPTSLSLLNISSVAIHGHWNSRYIYICVCIYTYIKHILKKKA